MTANLVVLAGLVGLLFPAGAAVWASRSAPSTGRESPGAAAYVLTALAVGLLGYVAVGFALSFGGVTRLYPALGELTALGSAWTPLATWMGPGWALAGASGFFVGVGDEVGAYALFFLQASVLAAVLSMLAAACAGRLRPQAFVLLVMAFAWLLYPLAVAWAWGGGWLSTLGLTRSLGHGFVDAGGGAVLLAVGAAALAVALTRRPAAGPAAGGPTAAASRSDSSAGGPAPEATRDEALALEQAPGAASGDLSAAALAGLAAMTAGWLGLLAGNSLMMGTSLPLVVVNAVAGAATGATVALGYMGFTTSRLNGEMGGRGLLAGLLAAGVAAPFISTPAAVLIGAVAGLLVCWSSYLAARLGLDDPADAVAVAGLGGLWGLIALGLFADGRTGQGWHGVGLQQYLGAAGQGVTGLLPAAGFLADPPQMAAQIVGIAAILLWVILPIGLVLRLSVSRTGPETADPA